MEVEEPTQSIRQHRHCRTQNSVLWGMVNIMTRYLLVVVRHTASVDTCFGSVCLLHGYSRYVGVSVWFHNRCVSILPASRAR